MRRSTTRGRNGEFLRIDDRTGFTEWSGDTVKEWTGAIVHRSKYEARHPQDFIRARREHFRVHDPRPDVSIASINSVGLLITEIAEDVPGNNNEYAPMGALGHFALGQAEDDFGDQEESNQAGSLSITVESTSGMSEEDRIGVTLDSGDVFLTQIDYITGLTTLQLTEALPGATSAGKHVIDYTATTQPSSA